MDTSRIDDRLRETYERSAPVVNEATFEAQLRRTTNRSRKQASAPRRRSGLRVAVYAIIAVVLVAAVAIGSLEAAKYLGKDQPILVITDDTLGPATTGQTTGTLSPTTTGQTTPTATSVQGEHWERLPVSEEGGEVWSLALDPSNPSVLYAGTQEGLFKSTDAAGSWSADPLAGVRQLLCRY